MPVSEFTLWQRYAARRMLPWRRMELYLAQVSLTAAKAMGGAKEATLADFLLDPPEDEEEQGDADDAQAFFAFAPRGGGSKLKE